jgi:hypothetical protein
MWLCMCMLPVGATIVMELFAYYRLPCCFCHLLKLVVMTATTIPPHLLIRERLWKKEPPGPFLSTEC